MMKENYKIRLIDKNDVERFVQIFRESFKTEYLIPSIYRGLGIKNFILNELNNPLSPYRYFGLFYNDKLIGCAEYKIINKDTFFLNLIASDNEFKGKGVGKAIINNTFEYFSKKGYNKVQLDVYEDNEFVLKWYQSLGFVELYKKSIYKLDNFICDETTSPVYILNYPQYKQLSEYYGFNYIDVMIDNKIVRLGVIENDLIIREEYSEYSKFASAYILKKLNFMNIYFIGDCNHKEPELIFMNNILRMELNLIG